MAQHPDPFNKGSIGYLKNKVRSEESLILPEKVMKSYIQYPFSSIGFQ